MNWAGTARTIIVCALMIVLQYTLRPLLSWRASIESRICKPHDATGTALNRSDASGMRNSML